MKKEKIDEIIEFLEVVLKRPRMYFGKDDDPELASNYLSGFRRGASIFANSNRSLPHIWHDVVTKRGHRIHAGGVSRALRKKGYENRQIVSELIEIEIEFWKTFYNESGN